MRLIVEPKKDGKGRAFSAELVAWAEADPLWVQADTNNHRPIWAVFAGSAEELRAFSANLQMGNVATDGARDAQRFELLRSAPYRSWTRALPGGGAVTTFAHHPLLSWKAPMDEALVYRFAVIPALSTLDKLTANVDVAAARDLLTRLEARAFVEGAHRAQEGYDWRTGETSYKPTLNLGALDDDQRRRFLGYGALLLHYLDHRLRLPLPRHPAFGSWLLFTGLEIGAIRAKERKAFTEGGAFWSSHYRIETPEAAGAAPGFTFNGGTFGCDLDQQTEGIKEWLGREVARWHKIGGSF